ncbi:hypothetical protein Hamer_G026713 [Homarus americanus]|uniref:Uncharacterized protein n=1 Tax=Homarus americanus TaxID=6706 RepID=A0A8J5TN39_HOMAM|nr:hypothetical protein Hamer_G026713 [Homarus americanus]
MNLSISEGVDPEKVNMGDRNDVEDSEVLESVRDLVIMKLLAGMPPSILFSCTLTSSLTAAGLDSR